MHRGRGGRAFDSNRDGDSKIGDPRGKDDGYRKLLFEPLEPRMLLSADLPVGAPDAFLDGLEEFAGWTDELAVTETLAQPLPLVSRSLGEEASNADLVRSRLIAPVSDYFTGDPTPTTGELRDYLIALPDGHFSDASVDDTDILLNLTFSATTTSTVPLDLGPDGVAQGLSPEALPDIELATTLTLDVSFGLDLADGSIDGDDFFVDVRSIQYDASVDADGLNFALEYGLLLPDVVDGQVDLDATARVDLDGTTGPGADGRLTRAELRDVPAADTVIVTGVGEASAVLPV